VFGLFTQGKGVVQDVVEMLTELGMEGWTSAFVTRVYEYNSFEPTIIELLTFWIAAAMGIASTFQCPKVCEDFDAIRQTPSTVYDVSIQSPESALALYCL
jgi:hypothetical protein